MFTDSIVGKNIAGRKDKSISRIITSSSEDKLLPLSPAPMMETDQCNQLYTRYLTSLPPIKYGECANHYTMETWLPQIWDSPQIILGTQPWSLSVVDGPAMVKKRQYFWAPIHPPSLCYDRLIHEPINQAPLMKIIMGIWLLSTSLATTIGKVLNPYDPSRVLGYKQENLTLVNLNRNRFYWMALSCSQYQCEAL